MFLSNIPASSGPDARKKLVPNHLSAVLSADADDAHISRRWHDQHDRFRTPLPEGGVFMATARWEDALPLAAFAARLYCGVLRCREWPFTVPHGSGAKEIAEEWRLSVERLFPVTADGVPGYAACGESLLQRLSAWNMVWRDCPAQYSGLPQFQRAWNSVVPHLLHSLETGKGYLDSPAKSLGWDGSREDEDFLLLTRFRLSLVAALYVNATDLIASVLRGGFRAACASLRETTPGLDAEFPLYTVCMHAAMQHQVLFARPQRRDWAKTDLVDLEEDVRRAERLFRHYNLAQVQAGLSDWRKLNPEERDAWVYNYKPSTVIALNMALAPAFRLLGRAVPVIPFSSDRTMFNPVGNAHVLPAVVLAERRLRLCRLHGDAVRGDAAMPVTQATWRLQRLAPCIDQSVRFLRRRQGVSGDKWLTLPRETVDRLQQKPGIGQALCRSLCLLPVNRLTHAQVPVIFAKSPYDTEVLLVPATERVFRLLLGMCGAREHDPLVRESWVTSVLLNPELEAFPEEFESFAGCVFSGQANLEDFLERREDLGGVDRCHADNIMHVFHREVTSHEHAHSF